MAAIKVDYDLLPVKDAAIADIAADALAQYQERREERLNTPIEPFSESLLKKLDAVVDINGTFRPTVSGILLFGRAPQRFPETRLGYIRLARFNRSRHIY